MATALIEWEEAIIAAVDQVGPAVVKIETGHSQGAAQQVGLGSGVIYSSDGYILTNAHVVQGASKVYVHLPDGRSMPAGVMGSEAQQDLAVLRVSERHLPVAHLYSGKVRVGQLVLAIGNPFGLDFTVTSGMISALERSLPINEQSSLKHLIQTDTSINPGNSGGPLVDIHGRVIGITTAILAYGQGIGFAIPTSTAYEVIDRVLERHRRGISQSVLGISGIDVNLEAQAIQNNHLQQRKGVLLLEVAPQSAAEQASLRHGDILLSLEDQVIDSVQQLRATIQQLRGRSPWRVSFLRQGRQRSVSLIPHRPSA
jgi:Trypsin-like serine proteases, typically periplasmic, contain C-terminal PDZ domain